jgi:hypothetical protein
MGPVQLVGARYWLPPQPFEYSWADSHRLHCPTGPAVEWDGWALYRLRGARVPAKLIEAAHRHLDRGLPP